MSRRTHRVLIAVVLAVVGAGVGGFIGAEWYEAFGPPWGQIGSEGEGLQEIIGGAVAGGLAGGLSAWFLVGLPRGHTGRALIIPVSVVAAVLLVVGSSFIGDLTNADGPEGIVSYVGFLALPVSLLLIAVLARLGSRARSGSNQTDAVTRR